MADDLSDVIRQAAQQPQQVSGDAGSVSMPSIPDLIAAAKFTEQQKAAKQAGGAPGLLSYVGRTEGPG